MPTKANIDPGRFGIAPYSAAKLTRLFERLPGIDRVWIYGSRARGDHRNESDIDLAIEATSEEASQGALRAVKELGLVYRVDVVDLKGINDNGFRSRIEQDKQLFWKSRNPPADSAKLERK